MKFTSRLFALLIALCLCCGMTASAATEISLSETAMLSVFEQSADEWYADDFNRALMATLTLIDIVIADETEEFTAILTAAMENDTTYIGRDQQTILVFFFGNNGQAIFAYYVPAYDAFTASIMQLNSGKAPEAQMKSILEADIVTSYYAVPYETMNMIYGAIVEAGE